MTSLPSRPGSRRLRRLSEDEIELWRNVTETVTQRPGRAIPDRLVRSPPTGGETALPVVAPAALPPPPPAKPALPPLAPLERKLKQKLSRGRSTADAAIDLHGLRQSEALAALQRFLRNAQRDGFKVVLVVTGKGGRSAHVGESYGDSYGVGVLKRAVPLWLSLPEFRTLVLGYEEAARSHGGSGALYVRLRRSR